MPATPPTPSPLPPESPSWKQGFGRRLGVYLFGVAIGCVMLGFFFAAKSRSKQQQLPQQQVAPAPGATPPAPTTPTTPTTKP